MNNEEKKEYEELKSLLYTGAISQYGKRKLIEIIEKQQKEIEDKKEEIYAIAKTNYTVGVLEERNEWYKKINEMIKKYEKIDKEEYARQGNFDVEISVLKELIGKEE